MSSSNEVTDGWVAAFLRDAIRVEASPSTVTNVIQMWLDNGVAASEITSALDLVSLEGSLERSFICGYRPGIIDLIAAERGEEQPSKAQRVEAQRVEAQR